MKRIVVDFRALAEASLALPGLPGQLAGGDVVTMLERLGVPDGMPFLIDDGGSLASCAAVNGYLLDAVRQGGLDLGSVRDFHSYSLARALRFIRLNRATVAAQADGISVDDWLADHGEPGIDLTSATRDDLVAFKSARVESVSAGRWNNEVSSLAGFFDYAVRKGWIERSPIPRWGSASRNTLVVRDRPIQQPKYLTEKQLRHFLVHGLRCDGAPQPARYRERNYAYGVLLATTGMRREEGARLLSCEIPTSGVMPSNGVWPFVRVGKGGIPRHVFVTQELVDAIDFYRRGERKTAVEKAQKSLRRARNDNRLLVFDGIEASNEGAPLLVKGSRRIPVERLSDEDRVRAVRITDSGEIEPLALFVSRYGVAFALKEWNEIFAEARTRLAELGHPDRPPSFIKVAPHTFRHTYAVRMLAALMRVGRETANDPYVLLANPVLTVTQLLGHADVSTTQQYLYAAERYTEELPTALRAVAANSVGHDEAPTAMEGEDA